MPGRIGCFVAYPSEPASLAETNEEAIKKIKEGQVVNIEGWKSTSPSGKFVINAICEAILKNEVFICDLTYLNSNVLFELGFAIAKKRRIWIIRDTNIEQSNIDYEKFRILTTVGYVGYSNSSDIVSAFYTDEPYKDLDNTIYRQAIESIINIQKNSSILYLKSEIETEASIKLTRRVDKCRIQVITDDPKEERVQTLSWYAEQVYNSLAVVAHFLSNDHIGARYHNAKNSFVSGMAFGFGKHLLMLGHEPFKSPIDYSDLLKVHSTATQCENFADNWLDHIEQEYEQKVGSAKDYGELLKARTQLQNISLGDSVAERESDTLLDYFILTSTYNEASEAKHLIVIGRKGAGKTAILYKLENEIASDKRNHVCIIKPVAYELEGILLMLSQALQRAERGYLIESFWKFLIYTELAKSVYESMLTKPTYYEFSREENELGQFIDNNASMIMPDFSIRLESVVNKLQNIQIQDTAENQRLRISELLHSSIITKLRTLLGNALEGKNKVSILVDNLDKAWTKRDDLNTLSDLLFGLLSVSRRIEEDFEKAGIKKQSINLSLIIFLRSDIFSQIIKFVYEKDKIPYTRIGWDDAEVLIRVIEERFIKSSDEITCPDDIWNNYLCSSVRGLPVKDYLIKYILPRPRDLIYLCKAAIIQAINRGHTKVEAEDIIDAQKQYSQYALGTLDAENGIKIHELEPLLYEFVASKEIVTRNQISVAMEQCNIPKQKLDEVVELLCDLTFIGIEIDKGSFVYLYNEENKAKFQVMARKTVESSSDKIERFKIHEAFQSYLEIKA